MLPGDTVGGACFGQNQEPRRRPQTEIEIPARTEHDSARRPHSERESFGRRMTREPAVARRGVEIETLLAIHVELGSERRADERELRRPHARGGWTERART